MLRVGMELRLRFEPLDLFRAPSQRSRDAHDELEWAERFTCGRAEPALSDVDWLPAWLPLCAARG